MISLCEVNAMTHVDFIERFGHVAEHAPWVAERAAGERPYASRDAMITAFQAAIRAAGAAAQLRLIRAHPDLAGRAAVAGDVTEDSRNEQVGAGLDRLTPDEFARFCDLNSRYRARFAIPFIFAVKGITKQQIIQGFSDRLGNDPEAELANALDQICRIVGFRIAERVAP
jgi:2-oxo-4-hydroxy-4-carboxy-5-ureidoimidazoline decarboxylase